MQLLAWDCRLTLHRTCCNVCTGSASLMAHLLKQYPYSVRERVSTTYYVPVVPT